MRNPLAAWRAGVRWPLALLARARGAGRRHRRLRSDRLAVPGRPDPAPAREDARPPASSSAATPSARRACASACSAACAFAPTSIEIGAPGWSPAPHMLLARDARLKLGYLDLWRAWHGRPLHVAALEAASLDARLERQADGRASWQFGTKKTGHEREAEASLPTFGRLRGRRRPRALRRRDPAGRRRCALRAQRRQRAARRARSASASAASGSRRAAQRRVAASGAASGGIFIRAGGARRRSAPAPRAFGSRRARAACA